MDTANRRAVVQIGGIVDGQEIVDAITAMFSDPAWQPNFDSLWDARSIERLNVRPDQVGEISRTVRQFNARRGPGKGALVVARDLDYTIGKFFTIVIRRPDRPIDVFRSMDEAMAWLSQQPPPELSSPGE